MKHLDIVYRTADQHTQPTISVAPTGLSSISVNEGAFVHSHVLEVTMRGMDGSYSRSYVNAIQGEIVK